MKTKEDYLHYTLEMFEQTFKELRAEARAEVREEAQKEKWLDGLDVRKLLNISASTLARLRKNEAIPYNKLGGKFYYPESYFTKSLKDKLVNKHLM